MLGDGRLALEHRHAGIGPAKQQLASHRESQDPSAYDREVMVSAVVRGGRHRAKGMRRWPTLARMPEASERAGQTVGRHYRGDLGEAYFDWQRRGDDLNAQIERVKFAEHVGSGDTVVDFGCGSAAVVASLPARERIGIEPNPPARRAGEGRGVRMVASTRELDDGIADVVISNHALEHTLAPLDELRELHRVLRPGGRLVLWLPLDDWRMHRRVREDENHHLYTWTPLLLRNLLDEAGFEVRECRVVTHAWPRFHQRLFRLLPRRVFDVLARAWAVFRRRRQVMALAERRSRSAARSTPRTASQ
jgi:SAM-dependent methyltransferase